MVWDRITDINMFPNYYLVFMNSQHSILAKFDKRWLPMQSADNVTVVLNLLFLRN